MKQLRTLKSYQNFKIKIKKLKTYSGWCPFPCLSNGTTLMQIQSDRTAPVTWNKFCCRINWLNAKSITFSLARNEKMVEVGDDPLCIIVRVLDHRPAINKNHKNHWPTSKLDRRSSIFSVRFCKKRATKEKNIFVIIFMIIIRNHPTKFLKLYFIPKFLNTHGQSQFSLSKPSPIRPWILIHNG